SKGNLFGAGTSASPSQGTVLPFGQTAGLSPLGDFGGPAPVHMPLPGSPAIDAGRSDVAPPTTDARGLARAVEISNVANVQSPYDIGAVEVQLTDVAGDFNGDGRTDVWFKPYGGGPWTLALSDGSAAFAHPISTLIANWTELYAGDFDGDGTDELLAWDANHW